MKQTTENLKEIMKICAKFTEEVYHDTRKGIPQTFYVVEIPDNLEFWNWETEQIEKIPNWAVGFWRTQDADDNTYYSYDYRIENDYWVKVKQQEIVTYEWITE